MLKAPHEKPMRATWNAQDLLVKSLQAWDPKSLEPGDVVRRPENDLTRRWKKYHDAQSSGLFQFFHPNLFLYVDFWAFWSVPKPHEWFIDVYFRFMKYWITCPDRWKRCEEGNNEWVDFLEIFMNQKFHRPNLWIWSLKGGVLESSDDSDIFWRDQSTTE